MAESTRVAPCGNEPRRQGPIPERAAARPVSVRFRVPFVTLSKKNAMVYGRGRVWVRQSASDRSRLFRDLACMAFRAAGFRDVAWPTEDVLLVLRHHVQDDSMEVEVRALGPVPRGKTGRRRDIHNLFDCVADALQGIAFANDNQVACSVGRRIACPSSARNPTRRADSSSARSASATTRRRQSATS